MEAMTTYPGSIGELVQGHYKGRDVLVSCPVNLYTKVKVFESNNAVNKKKYDKASAFAAEVLKRWNYCNIIDTIDIEISSQIPRGKGFASSTADLCATYYSLLKLFNRNFNEEELINCCIQIEPTDSIIFDNLTAFDYKNGLYKEHIGKYIEFYIWVFEGTSVVNTVEFNNRRLPSHKPVDDLIERLTIGAKQNSVPLIAEACSESIIRNQHRLKYSILPNVLKLQQQYGGLGVLGAHSGDMIGIIFDDEEKLDSALKKIQCFKNYKGYKLKTLHIL